MYQNFATFLADVSMPEVSREDLPPRVQEFLRCDDENFESQLQEQSDEQVWFCSLFDLGYIVLNVPLL